MPPEPWILGFDTSAAHCAAALLCGDRLVAEALEPMEKGQAERLMPLLAELLAQGGIGWRDLAAIGVGTGPGNFTGVRIAVSAARGLALALKVPAIGITRFEAAAFGLPRPVAVVEDARRGEAFVQAFAPDAGPAHVGLLADLAEGLTMPLVGSGAAAVAGAQVLAQPLPLAEAIARLAAQRLGATQPRPAPFYLRPADAAPSSDPPPVMLP
ncbi:tRNA (adenosine(37)-N6)-threonylcarbamoyltransferase complex dimerization subunit type 1 TsaB [Rhodobacter ferrooxidans]|uniref:Peptidase M22 glycoprotease n=1 Tax=Rhodobacter ferrooxidans TaxID=371731 RepID=C8RXN2_9RHOB|nr:tRNA (adenosine(37)-N6)-threonylcarbamoyltransferase complex dimerization subunit type 1 TsaB [Rhodobacter sp. SW2]EEW26757.1 peptidase M22 glycoprotease [Rhodobacter sp. SW2]